jgi:ABC-2 type transport system permease protein
MFVIFKRKLAKNLLMILGWGIGLAILGYFIFHIYDTIFKENVNLTQIIDIFPTQLLAFFGDIENFFEPKGFLSFEFYSYIPIFLGILIVSSAGNLIAKAEENGTLEVTIAQPISRSAVFWGNLFALLLTIVLILSIAWVGFILGARSTSSFDVSPGALLLPMVSLFAVLLVFLSLALLLSMILTSSSTAGLIAGFFLIASYFITSLARIEDKLKGINRFSPLKYYQSGGAMDGLNFKDLAILLSISVILIGIAWFIFVKRDLRFGGSGGFRLVFPHQEKPAE